MSCIPEKPPEPEKEGLSHLDWNRIVDGYLKTKRMTVDDYEALDPFQTYFIQTMKKHFKRIDKPVINKRHHSLINKKPRRV
jgi:hypothetical protein